MDHMKVQKESESISGRGGMGFGPSRAWRGASHIREETDVPARALPSKSKR